MKRLFILFSLLIYLSPGNAQFLRNPLYIAPPAPLGDTLTWKGILGDGETIGWYNADNAARFTITADTTTVATWIDLSVNSLNLSGVAGAARPVYDNINNEVDFDGVNDYLTKSSWVYDQPITIYFVIYFENFAANDRLIRLDADNIRFYFSNTATWCIRAGGIYFCTGEAPFSYGTYYIITLIFNNDVANGSRVQLNDGSSVNIVGTINTNATSVLELSPGTGACAKFSIKEFIIRNTVEIDASKTKMIDHLNDKYTIF